MKFWTKEQYLKFAEAMMDKPRSYYAFEMLYWTGIREMILMCNAKRITESVPDRHYVQKVHKNS